MLAAAKGEPVGVADGPEDGPAVGSGESACVAGFCVIVVSKANRKMSNRHLWKASTD